MAPEYAMFGKFSIKSDIFSFGVLIIEIITGQKVNGILHDQNTEDLLLEDLLSFVSPYLSLLFLPCQRKIYALKYYYMLLSILSRNVISDLCN